MNAFTFKPLHASFCATASGMDLREVHAPARLNQLRAAMDTYGVLVFRQQPFSDAEQLAFAQRFDGTLHTKTGIAALTTSRLGNEALTDISNVDENGDLAAQYGINTIPRLMVFKGSSTPVQTVNGSMNEAAMMQMLNGVL